MTVKILGSSGTYPLYWRPLAAALVNYNEYNFLIDCGEGTQLQLQRYKRRWSKINAIFLTHLHLDHIMGIPGLLATMTRFERTDDLLIVGPRGTEECIRKLLTPIHSLNFNVQFLELTSSEVKFDFGNLKVAAFAMDHSVACYGYKFSEMCSPRFNAEVIESSNIPLQFWNAMGSGATVEIDGKVVSRNSFFGKDRYVRSFVYAVDTRPCRLLKKYCKLADVLVLEAMYFHNNYKYAREKKHMLLSEAVDIFKRSSKAKYLVLTHFSPSVQKGDTDSVKGAVCAYAGMTITIEEEIDFGDRLLLSE